MSSAIFDPVYNISYRVATRPNNPYSRNRNDSPCLFYESVRGLHATD
jgi:hypothetical protein